MVYWVPLSLLRVKGKGAAWILDFPTNNNKVMTGPEFGVVRFNEMKKYIESITFKTLSTALKQLEADGLVHREEYPQIPPKVEYSLTERGRSLIPILDSLCEWGETHRQ